MIEDLQTITVFIGNPVFTQSRCYNVWRPEQIRYFKGWLQTFEPEGVKIGECPQATVVIETFNEVKE